MKKGISQRAGILSGIAIGFVVGSVASSAVFKGSLADTGPCLSSGLKVYLSEQTKLMQNHANAIQSIVSNLQNKVQLNNGASIATDFSAVNSLLQNEDRSFAQKISQLTEDYRKAQATCQTNGTTSPLPSSSYTTTPQKSSTSPSSSTTSVSSSRASSSLKSAAPIKFSSSSEEDDYDDSEDDYFDEWSEDDDYILDNSSSVRSSAVSKSSSSSSQSSTSSQSTKSGFDIEFLTVVPSIRRNGQFVAIASVTSSTTQSTDSLYLVPEGPMASVSNVKTFGKMETRNGTIVNLTTKNQVSWQLIDSMLDGDDQNISKADREKSVPLYVTGNEEVLKSGFRLKDYARVINDQSIEEVAGFVHAPEEDIINSIANRSNTPRLQYLVRELNANGGLVTIHGKITNNNPGIMNTIVFIGDDVIHHVYTKKFVTEENENSSYGTTIVRTAEMNDDGTFSASLYGNGKERIWMIDASIDGDPTTVTEGDVYGSILLNRGTNQILLTDAPWGTVASEAKSETMVAVPSLTLAKATDPAAFSAPRVSTHLSPFFSTTKLDYVFVKKEKRATNVIPQYFAIKKEDMLVGWNQNALGLEWIGIVPFRDLSAWINSGYSDEYILNKTISPY